MSKSRSRVTAKDIARVAGVSQATVSMALRGSSEISETRIAEIRNIANQMNYHPRAAAQLLRCKRSGQLGVLVAAPDAVHAFSRGFTGPLLGSFVDICAQKDVRYVIEFHAHDSAPSNPPYQITSGLVDGSVVIGDVGEPLRQFLADSYASYPYVSIDEPSRFCVLADSRRGVAEIVEHLVDLGHRRLAYAVGPQRYFTHHEGFLGWQDSIRRNDLSIPENRVLFFGSVASDKGIAANNATDWTRGLLRQSDRPTAIVCHDMVIARAVIHLATEMGLNVPRDLSVTSWGWHLTAQEQIPPLSTMELDYRLMMERGFELLNRLIEKDAITESKIVVALKYVEGATVAPPTK
jgi:LacI family transcriptional regulator